MGFEPTTFGTTIRHSNQLSYIHHFRSVSESVCKGNILFAFIQIYRRNFYVVRDVRHTAVKPAIVVRNTRRGLLTTDSVPPYLPN